MAFINKTCNRFIQVVHGAEILEILHAQPALKEYLMSLYDCRYAEFFKSLGECFTLLLLPTNEIVSRMKSKFQVIAS